MVHFKKEFGAVNIFKFKKRVVLLNRELITFTKRVFVIFGSKSLNGFNILYCLGTVVTSCKNEYFFFI
jgi:hypothetical protein